MKLLRIHIIAAETCGGLLDGVDIWLRSPTTEVKRFEPLCLIGPNGAGKSQFLQVVAEIFQVIFHATIPREERGESNVKLQFEVEYLIQAESDRPIHVLATRKSEGKHKPFLTISTKENDEWINCDIHAHSTLKLLPQRVVGYTSGGNETLSLPFLISRSGYADEVRSRAIKNVDTLETVPDTRLMMIDYSTHLEVLVANLLLGADDSQAALLQEARLKDIQSFRCVVQLAHSAAPKAQPRQRASSIHKGIQLTPELEKCIDQLRRCSTCHNHNEQTDSYIFDFYVNEQTKWAFRHFWKSTLELYSAFHKLAMLNDLAIPKKARDRFKKDTQSRRFASRLPEPQDEDKVFRFERVTFHPKIGDKIVEYVSLSDGEHQLAQLLGTMCMVSFPNVLFLLDEPESHFNPQWRVKFMSRLLDLPTPIGTRRDNSPAAQQECLLTTHAPFVPSDMARDNVFIFRKEDKSGEISIRQPDIETFGTTFDAILSECFNVRPPISELPRQEINALMSSKNVGTIKAGMERLGNSVEKILLADRIRQLQVVSGNHKNKKD